MVTEPWTQGQEPFCFCVLKSISEKHIQRYGLMTWNLPKTLNEHVFTMYTSFEYCICIYLTGAPPCVSNGRMDTKKCCTLLSLGFVIHVHGLTWRNYDVPHSISTVVCRLGSWPNWSWWHPQTHPPKSGHMEKRNPYKPDKTPEFVTTPNEWTECITQH